MNRKLIAFSSMAALLAAAGFAQDLILRGGTVLTITRGIIENGTVIIQKGKITGVGEDLPLPPGIPVVEAAGKFVIPGIVDSHTHIGFDGGDINELSDPVTPQIWMKDALDPYSDLIFKTLTSGVTAVKAMHGSANVIGGVNVTIKTKYGSPVEEMIVPGVRQQLKLALGENPKRIYGQAKGVVPSTRMGNAYVLRKAFLEAREYKDTWDAYEKDRAAGKKGLAPPKRDLTMETLKMVLEKKLAVDCHTYRAEEIVWIINFCRENGIDLKQLSHCIDGYKVCDIIAESGVAFGGWVDLWGFKEEAYDNCPFGFKLMHDAGVNIALNSDGLEEGLNLNRAAAKVLKYNDIPEEEALKMITINAARALELDGRAGSLEVGKDGDVAVFDKHPLDTTAKCVMTIIEGKIYFDYAKDSVTAQGARR